MLGRHQDGRVGPRGSGEAAEARLSGSEGHRRGLRQEVVAYREHPQTLGEFPVPLTHVAPLSCRPDVLSNFKGRLINTISIKNNYSYIILTHPYLQMRKFRYLTTQLTSSVTKIAYIGAL